MFYTMTPIVVFLAEWLLLPMVVSTNVVTSSYSRSTVFEFPLTGQNKDIYYPDFTLKSVKVGHEK